MRCPDLLVNVSPIGLAGGTEEETLALDTDGIGSAEVVFEVAALPPETPLIRYARSHGKLVFTGVEVIALQAAEQFAIYTGIRPTEAQIRRASAYLQLVPARCRISRVAVFGRALTIRTAYGHMIASVGF